MFKPTILELKEAQCPSYIVSRIRAILKNKLIREAGSATFLVYMQVYLYHVTKGNVEAEKIFRRFYSYCSNILNLFSYCLIGIKFYFNSPQIFFKLINSIISIVYMYGGVVPVPCAL